MSSLRETGSATLARRSFLGSAGRLALSTTALGALQATTHQAEAAPLQGSVRRNHLDRELLAKSYQVRVEAARSAHFSGLPAHPNNGDEALYPNKIGSDTRGLSHDAYGEVDPTAWQTLVRALESQREQDFERVTLGGTRKLVQPLATLAVNLTGLAAPQYSLPTAPTLAGAERAAEAVEAYWQSLLRDTPFWEYSNDTRNQLVLAAARELTSLPAYTGPRDAHGQVTPELLFRGSARYRDPRDRTGRDFISHTPPGVAVGPYISQFLLKDIPYGTQSIPGQLRVPGPGHQNDFLTDYAEWLDTQNGITSLRSIALDGVRRYLSTGRDLAEYAHASSPSVWGAALLLLASQSAGGIGARLNPSNPYLRLSKSASGFGSFGSGYIQGLLPLSSSQQIRITYWQKWFVHRTLRPEAYGGLVHHVALSASDYPVHDDILVSEAVDRSYREFGTYLLSQAYPEGAPNHGSYPGGASSIAAVAVSVLKAFFDESFEIPNPVQPDPSDPTRLIPYVGPPLTVGGELNKLVTNLGQGRNWAGIHWRSDAASSLPLSEEVAIALLRDEQRTFKETFDGFSFTRFDGSTVSI